jgi:glycosyltransferase involved in cell wall biosynthesis
MPAESKIELKQLVTVVIPCFNAEKTIEKTVSSALEQSIGRPKVIIVDDGSTDSSAEILSQLVEHNTDVLTVVSTVNNGACYARRAGVKTATTEYVAFLDADDFWHPQKLEFQLKLFLSNDCLGGITTGFQNHKSRTWLTPRERNFEWNRKEMVRWVFMGASAPALNSTLLIRKDFYWEIGGHDTSLGSHADDLDLGWRLFLSSRMVAKKGRLAFLGASTTQVHLDIEKMAPALETVIQRIGEIDPILSKKALRYLGISNEIKSRWDRQRFIASSARLMEWAFQHPGKILFFLTVRIREKTGFRLTPI